MKPPIETVDEFAPYVRVEQLKDKALTYLTRYADKQKLHQLFVSKEGVHAVIDPKVETKKK